MRRRRLVPPALLTALTALLALSAVTALAGCTADSPTTPPSGSGSAPPADDSAPSPTPTASAPPAGVHVTDLDDAPVGVAAVGTVAWVALPDAGRVLASHGQRVAVGDLPLRLVGTPAGVWVSVIGDGTLVRIDPGTGDVDRRVRLRPAGSEPEGLAYDGRLVWVVDQAGDRLVPLDPVTGTLGRPVAVGAAPRLVSSGPSGLWVSNYDGGSVSRVTTGPGGPRVRTVTVPRCLTPQGLAEAAGVVWIACTVDSRVVGLDARTLERVAVLGGLQGADQVVAHGNTVYAVGQHGPTVWTIDARRRTRVHELVLDTAGGTSENVDAAVVGRRLVVTHPEVSRMYDVRLALLDR
jgi:hypothetical protein